MQLKITPMKNPTGPLQAFVDITFGNGLLVKGFKVMTGRNGLWVSSPSKKKGEEWEDICYFPDKETGQAFQKAVLAEYSKMTGKGGDEPGASSGGPPRRTRGAARRNPAPPIPEEYEQYVDEVEHELPDDDEIPF